MIHPGHGNVVAGVAEGVTPEGPGGLFWPRITRYGLLPCGIPSGSVTSKFGSFPTKAVAPGPSGEIVKLKMADWVQLPSYAAIMKVKVPAVCGVPTSATAFVKGSCSNISPGGRVPPARVRLLNQPGGYPAVGPILVR